MDRAPLYPRISTSAAFDKLRLTLAPSVSLSLSKGARAMDTPLTTPLSPSPAAAIVPSPHFR